MVTVHTDHNPLVPIFSKSILNAPKRLQRMILRLQKYNLVVKYCPGSQMHIADMLSRAYLKDRRHRDNTLSDFPTEESVLADSEIETVNFAEYLRVSEASQATQQQIITHSQTSHCKHC